MSNKELEKYLKEAGLIKYVSGAWQLNTGAMAGAGVATPRTPNLIQLGVAGNTPINVVSFSIVFRGTGGTFNGITVPDNYSASFGNGTDMITTAMPFTPPTAGEARVLISTLV